MSDSAEKIVLACEGLSKSYHEGSRDLPVLSGVDLRVVRGETIAIIGASGSGKSTLLNMLGGLDLPSAGEVQIAGQAVAGLRDDALSQLRNRALGFVYQFHHLLPEFTAVENVAMPLLIAGHDRRQAIAEASALLQRVGLAERLTHKPAELSGGERQRVAIARALVNHPACVLMDEPTGNLDSASAANILALIDELAQAGDTAFIVVTHDVAVAKRMQHCYRLHGGSLSKAELSTAVSSADDGGMYA